MNRAEMKRLAEMDPHSFDPRAGPREDELDALEADMKTCDAAVAVLKKLTKSAGAAKLVREVEQYRHELEKESSEIVRAQKK